MKTHQSETARARPLRSGFAAKTAAVAALAALSFGTLTATQASIATADDASNAQTGCSYGTDGPNADTLCWIDMSGLNTDEAKSAAGQPMSISLPGGYEMSFVAHLTAGSDQGPRDVVATSLPTYGGAVLGNAFYKNTAGKPALWIPQAQPGEDWNGWVSTITLDNVKVANQAGATNSTYSLVVADAESTDGSGGGENAEGLRFFSDSSLNQLATAQPAGYSQTCAGGLSGVGTNEVTCLGLPGDKSTSAGAQVLKAKAPSKIGASMKANANSREAIAFAVQFSTVQVTKDLAKRYDANDNFTVSSSTTDTELGGATTAGSATNATTGRSTLVSDADGDRVTFTEKAASPSVDWSHYQNSWSCTRNGKVIPSSDLTYADDGRSVAAHVGVGDFVDCTVTNTALLGGVSWQKTDADGAALNGSQWSLTASDGSVINVADNGQNDGNPAAGALSVSDLPWGQYTLKETQAPVGYDMTDESKTVTIDAQHLNETFGSITNSRKAGLLSWSKVDGDTSAALGGSEWTLKGPDGTTAPIVDNGQNDRNPADGELQVGGLAWGDYSLVETKAPAGYLLASDPIPVKVDAEHTNIDLKGIANTQALPGLHIEKSSDPASGAKVDPGQVISYAVDVTNTGNIPLTPATISDDLSDVLDNTSYVEGSAQATIAGAAADAPTVDTENHVLSWQGTLKPGESAKLTYQVKVNADANDADRIVNVVTGDGVVPPGTPSVVPNCVPATASETAECTTNHVPSVPAPPAPTPDEPAVPVQPDSPDNSSATPPSNNKLARTGFADGPVELALIAGLLAVTAGAGLTLVKRRRKQS